MYAPAFLARRLRINEPSCLRECQAHVSRDHKRTRFTKWTHGGVPDFDTRWRSFGPKNTGSRNPLEGPPPDCRIAGKGCIRGRRRESVEENGQCGHQCAATAAARLSSATSLATRLFGHRPTPGPSQLSHGCRASRRAIVDHSRPSNPAQVELHYYLPHL
jgi:hypothetical protein